MRKKPENSQFHFNMSTIALIAAIAIAVFGLLNTKRKIPPKDNSLLRQYPIMGTMAAVKLYGDDALTNKAADAIHAELRRVESICNLFDPKSELSRLNKSAAVKPFVCSKTLWNVLLEARHFHQLSDGAFDVTAKPLMDLWGFYRKRQRIPSGEEIVNALKNVGMDKVVFNPKYRSISFTQPGVTLDLGGIAKGYAVDRAADAAKALGLNCGMINLGGNIYCFPVPPPGKNAYTIGIRNPLNKNDICGTINVLDRSIATSGDYERTVTLEGKRYSHIMNVKTGYPVENTLSATVVTPLAVFADALSTSVFINGADFARKMVERIPATQCLLIQRGDAEPHELEITTIGDVWSDVNLTNAPAPKKEK